MKTTFVNIEQAIHTIQNALYQPINEQVAASAQTVSLSEKMKHILTREERVALQELKAGIEKIKIDSKQVLLLDPSIEIHQTTIDKIQIERLILAFALVKKELKLKINTIQQQLNGTQKYSEQYRQCLTSVEKNLKNLLTLVEEYQEENKTAEYYRAFYKKNLRDNDIHVLCRLIGVVYFPINQGLDPLFGGKEVNGRVVQSEGECAGKVLSWIYACSNDEPLKYPFFVGENDKRFQNAQADIKKKFTVKACEKVNQFCSNLFNHIEDDALYYIALNGPTGGHGIGLRKRNDGVYELFDSNYFHAFIPTKEMFTILLTYLVTSYAIESEFENGVLFKADVTQSKQIDKHFPNKISLIPASFAQFKSDKELDYVDLLKKLILSASGAYHKNPQMEKTYRELLLTNLDSMLVMVNEIETLNKLDALFKDSCVKGNLFSTEADTLACREKINTRRVLISDKTFRTEVAERRQEANDYIEAEKTIIAELNTVKEQLVKANKEDDLVKRHHEQEGLAVKSMKLHQFFTQLRHSDAPVKLFLQPLVDLGKKIINSVRNAITGIFKKKTSAPVPEVQNITSQVKTSITDANRDYEEHKAIENKPILQKRSELNQLINALVLHARLVTKRFEEKRHANLTARDNGTHDKQLENENQHVDRVYQHCLKQTEELVLALKAVQKDTIETYKGETGVDQQAHSAVVKLENKVHQLVKLDASMVNSLLSNSPRNEQLLDVLENTMFEKACDSCPAPSEAVEAESVETDTSDRIELLRSLQKLIESLDQSRESVVAKIRAEYLTHLQGNFERQFMRRKILAEVDKISSQIKILVAAKNSILKSNNQESFVQVAAKMRSMYPSIFEHNFKLPENFAHCLYDQLGINVTQKLNEEERKLVERLTAKHQECQTVIEIYSKQLQSNRLVKEGYIQQLATTGNIPHKFLLQFSIQHTDIVSDLLTALNNRMKLQQQTLMSVTTSDTKILDEMRIELPDMLRLLFKKENTIAYWSMVQSGELYRVQRLYYYLHDCARNFSHLLLVPSTGISLIPPQLSSAYNEVVQSNLMLLDVKIGESEVVSNDIVCDFVNCFPSLQHSDPSTPALKNDLFSNFLKAPAKLHQLSSHIYQLIGNVKQLLEHYLSPIDDPRIRRILLEKMEQLESLMDACAKGDQLVSLTALNTMMHKINAVIPNLVNDNYELSSMAKSIQTMKADLIRSLPQENQHEEANELEQPAQAGPGF